MFSTLSGGRKEEVIGLHGNRKRGSSAYIRVEAGIAREWPSSSLPVSVTRIRFAASAISFEGLLSGPTFDAVAR